MTLPTSSTVVKSFVVQFQRSIPHRLNFVEETSDDDAASDAARCSVSPRSDRPRTNSNFGSIRRRSAGNWDCIHHRHVDADDENVDGRENESTNSEKDTRRRFVGLSAFPVRRWETLIGTARDDAEHEDHRASSSHQRTL